MDMGERSGDFRASMARHSFVRIAFIAAVAAIAVVLVFLSLTVGTRDLSMGEVFRLFIDHLSGVTYDRDIQHDLWYDDNIVWNYRLPRALFAIIAGAGLAVAGAAMQSVMKNPLADPYTTGISSGALLGVAVAMVLGFSAGMGGIDGYGTIINAMIFAMIPVIVIYVMSPFLNKSPATLILAGTAVSYLFNSLTDILLVSTDEETLSTVYKWQVGNLSDLSWDAIPFVLVSCVVGMAVLMVLSNKLNLMSLDDKDAKALGLDSERMRIVCLIVLSFMAASIISFAGIIGFVGLIVPHMVRLVVGSDNRFVIPGAIAVGGAFLLGCDIVSRAIDVSAVIPVGVITSLIGAPIFLALIIRQRRSVWRRLPTGSGGASPDTGRRPAAGCSTRPPSCWCSSSSASTRCRSAGSTSPSARPWASSGTTSPATSR